MADKSKFDIKIKLDDNSPEVLAALKIAIKRGLWAMGAAAEDHAANDGDCPVDTGRLKNSITHQETEDQTVIGTNVEYAVFQELGTSRGIKAHHFLKNAVANHTKEYKDLLVDSLKNA